MYGIFTMEQGGSSRTEVDTLRAVGQSQGAGEPCRFEERGLDMGGPSAGVFEADGFRDGRRERRIALAFDGFLLEPEQGMGLRNIADLYALHGADFVRRLNGAFVFALYDFEQGSLMLARDSLGEKSLYYACRGGHIAFASESSALPDIGFGERVCDESSLRKYLTFGFVPDEYTMLRGVRKLLPGEYIIASAKGTHRERYWRPREHESAVGADDSEDVFESQRREARDILEAAVDSRLALFPECGIFLSGGLDSSLVAALVARRRPAPPTFSIHFGSEYAGESYYSDLVARHCSTEHRVLEIKPAAFVEDLPEIIARLDEPIGDAITVPNYLLARMASEHVGAVFNGEGGDPLFGGPKNIPLMLAALFESDGEIAYLKSYRKMYSDLPELMSGGLSGEQDEELRAIARPFLDDEQTKSYLNKLMGLNTVLKGGCNILVKVARTYSRNGLTPLSPLFDRRLVDFAFRVPPAWKLRGRVEKYILKHAVQDLLPDEVVWREKSGMMVPVHHWFRRELRPFARSVLAPAELNRHGFFDGGFVEKILNYDLPDQVLPGYGAKLWMLLSFQLWYRAVIDRA